MKDDFRTKSGDKNAEPMYKYVHIIFNRPIDSKLTAKLFTNNKKLTLNLCSLKQICFTSHPIDEGLFSLKIEDPLKLKASTGKIVLQDHIVSLLSMVRSIENLQIIYDGNDSNMMTLVQEISPMIQGVLDVQFENKLSTQRIPPVFLILLDRKKDLITPLLQNNSYGSMFYTLLEKLDNVLDFKISNPDRRKEAEEGKSLLNERDSIWTEHKYTDCIQVITKVNSAYQKFMEENARNQGGDVLEQMRKAPELKEYIKDFNKHLQTLRQIMEKIKSTNFQEVFFYEQALATGKKKNGDSFNPSHINKSKLVSDFDKVRISVLAKLLHKLDDNSIQNMIFEKKDAKMMARINDICELIEKHATSELGFLDPVQDVDSPDTMFYRSRAARIFYEKITGNLGEVFENFETKDLYPKGSSNKIFNNYIFKKNTLAEGKCPIVILFMNGGLSHNEVMEINNLKKISHLGDFIPICGGSEVFSAFSYMKYLQDVVAANDT